jgi:hypothetical protein
MIDCFAEAALDAERTDEGRDRIRDACFAALFFRTGIGDNVCSGNAANSAGNASAMTPPSW